MALQDSLLPVQWQMVDTLGHDYLRQQTRPCRAFFDWLCWLASRSHRAGTGIFQAGIFHHQHRSWHIFVAFAGFLPHQAQILMACGTVLFVVREIVYDALPFEVPRQRLPATALLGVTNSYFDGITTHDGNIIQAHPGCLRVENGVTVTGRALQAGQVQANGWQTSDCTSGLATINIQNVAARRYPIVDEEAGMVMAMAVFIRKPGSPQRRNVFAELFFLDGHKIRSIYSEMFYPPPEAPVPNWPTYDGNWPMPASFGAAQ